MTISAIAKQAAENGAVLIRYRANSHAETGTAEYDCKPIFTGSKRGWTMLDSFTASAMKAVYEKLKPEHQAKFDNIPLGRLVDFVWKQVA